MEPVGVREGQMVLKVMLGRQQMVTISKYQAQVRIKASPHAYVHLQDFHSRNGTCIRHLTNDMLLFCYYLCSCVCSRHSDPIMTNSGVTLAKDLNALIIRVYSQLTVISFDAFGGTVALPTVDVAHVGMVVTLAGCREQRKGGGVQKCFRPAHIRVPRHAVS